MTNVEKPIYRSKVRHRLGMAYYGMLRKLLWLKKRKFFAKSFQKELLPYSCFSHRTILLRKLKDVDM